MYDLSAVANHDEWRWCALKGSATGEVLYPNPVDRQMGDVDILVAPGDFQRAALRLRKSRFINGELPFMGPATCRGAHALTFIHRNGSEVDLHRRVNGVFVHHELNCDWILSTSRAVPIPSGQLVPLPSLEALVLHAMLHISTGKAGPGGLAAASTMQDLMRAWLLFPDQFRSALEMGASDGLAVPTMWAARAVEEWIVAAGGTPLDLTSIRRHTISSKIFRLTVALPGASSLFRRLRQKEGTTQMREAWTPTAEYLASVGTSLAKHRLTSMGLVK